MAKLQNVADFCTASIHFQKRENWIKTSLLEAADKIEAPAGYRYNNNPPIYR
ncbi:MAG TPA: hypothetical protein VK106_06375 [Balneolaceae bacterium]|nr:hypothetical protein [Balneolaceae bacterium]